MKTLIAAVVLAAAVALGGLRSADAEVRLKMASVFSSKLAQLGDLGKTLEANVRELSGGALQLEFLEPGTLAPAGQLFEAVKAGSVDAAWSSPGYWRDREPGLALFSAVPFGPRAAEYGAWLLHRGGEQIMQRIYARHGIHSMVCGVIAPEASGWFRSRIKSLDDLKGKRMRIFGLGATVMARLGVDVQTVDAADILQALEDGTIDGIEFSQPAIDLSLGFHEVAKHYYFPGWHQQSTAFELMVNKARWDALSAQHQAMLRVACRANFALGMTQGEAIQGKALATLRSKGVTIHRWPEEILDKLEATWNEVAKDLAAKDAGFKEAWESLQAFRAEYRSWGRLGYLR